MEIKALSPPQFVTEARALLAKFSIRLDSVFFASSGTIQFARESMLKYEAELKKAEISASRIQLCYFHQGVIANDRLWFDGDFYANMTKLAKGLVGLDQRMGQLEQRIKEQEEWRKKQCSWAGKLNLRSDDGSMVVVVKSYLDYGTPSTGPLFMPQREGVRSAQNKEDPRLLKRHKRLSL